MNNYFALFFVAFAKEGTIYGKKSHCHSIESPFSDGPASINSCMAELQLQLITIVVLKQ
eukprot:SAG22_NODE_4999_length_1111_cov_1.603755_1_plen_58_part_10